MKVFLLFLFLTVTSFSKESNWSFDTFQYQETTLPFASLRLGTDEKQLPLVLFLHGSGERGHDNRAQLKHGMNELKSWCLKTKQPCHILAPQCPQGVSWSETDHSRSPEKLSFRQEQPILESLLGLIEKIANEQKIDRSRIYLTGLSMGGYGSFALLKKSPDTFAAALPICGGGEISTVENFKTIPIHIVHGDEDEVVPVELSRSIFQALRTAKAPHLHYTEMLKTGHDSWTATYRNPRFWEWMFAQEKS